MGDIHNFSNQSVPCRQAEEKFKKLVGDKTFSSMTPEEIASLCARLRDHQVELARENENLLNSRRTLQYERNKFLDLFDFSPMGYLCLDEFGTIREANLTAAALLSIDRAALVGTVFGRFVEENHLRQVETMLDRARQTGGRQIEDVRLYASDGTAFDAHMVCSLFADKGRGNGPQMRLAIIDASMPLAAQADLARSLSRVRRLNAYLQRAHEREKQALAKEIHDDICQMLAFLKMELTTLDEQLADHLPQQGNRPGSLIDVLETLIRTTKRLVYELRPSLLDELGLVAAMESAIANFRAQTGINTEFLAQRRNMLLDRDRATAVYRIFQEILNNIGRHSGADHVVVELSETPDAIGLEVRDNGCGMDRDKIFGDQCFGLLAMRERANGYGGDVSIDTYPGRGTRVFLRMPRQ